MRIPLRLPPAIIAAVLLTPSAAPGAVTIGSDFSRNPTTTVSCEAESTSCAAIQTSLPGNAVGLTVPYQGVIKTYRIKAAAAGQRAGLRAYRPRGDGGYELLWTDTIVGAVGAGVTTWTTTSRGRPVAAGDVIATYLPDDDAPMMAAPFPGATSMWLETSSAGLELLPYDNYEMFLQADVEPDADADGYGDETDDACPAEAAKHRPRCSADLQVTNQVSRPAAGAGSSVVNTVTIVNAGPSATDAAIKWSTTTPSPSIGLGAITGPCRPAIGVRPEPCTLTLGPGQTTVLAAELKMPASKDREVTAGRIPITSTASADASAIDTQPANNAASATFAFSYPDTRVAFTVRSAGAVRARSFLRSGIRFRVHAPERITRGTARLYLRRGGRDRLVGVKRWSASGSRTKSVRVRLRPQGKRLVRRARRGRSPIRLRLVVTGEDRAGNEGVATLTTLRVRR